MPRVVVPVVLLCLCVPACRSWPSVRCDKRTRTAAAQHLNAIERIVASEKDATLRQSILDAVYRCRNNAHVRKLEQEQHCAAVANAAAYASISQNKKCLAALHHGTKGAAAAPPTTVELQGYVTSLNVLNVDKDWLLYRDPDPLRVINYIAALITLARPEAMQDPNSDAAKVMNRALECLAHKKEYPGGSPASADDHLQFLVNAYNVMSSVPPEQPVDWKVVFKELDHMVSEQ